MTERTRPWSESVAYQVYPWSFNEDEVRNPQKGIGSARGVAERLPYLKELGVDVVWISPHYASPMIDGGYDVSDFRSIHPDFGTLEDEQHLIEQAHAHGMRIMLDFVPNHTSTQHEWFQKSRRHQDGYDDWYIWHPGITSDDGSKHAPNNWASVFSIPNKVARANGEMPWLEPDEPTPAIAAWRFDEQRGEFYLAEFAREQPSLNWSNGHVREAMKDEMRFWLDQGVDGIRVDVANHLGKNMMLPNEIRNTAYHEQIDENPYDQWNKYESNSHIPAMKQYIKELTDVAKESAYRDRDIRIVLEMYLGEETLRRTDEIAPDVASTFNFVTMRLGWSATQHKLITDLYYAHRPEGFIGNQVNGNHDNPRLATRLGDVRARAAFIKNIFMPGTRYIYNGEELGLHDGPVPPDRVKDPNGLRDGARTPLIIDHRLPSAGFSNADPRRTYLPINENDLALSYEHQKDDPLSSFHLYKSAIALAHTLPVLRKGHYTSLRTDNEAVFAYGRTLDDDQAVILTNFSGEPQRVSILGSAFIVGRSALSSVSVLDDLKTVDLHRGVTLLPDEAVLVARANDSKDAIL